MLYLKNPKDRYVGAILNEDGEAVKVETDLLVVCQYTIDLRTDVVSLTVTFERAQEIPPPPPEVSHPIELPKPEHPIQLPQLEQTMTYDLIVDNYPEPPTEGKATQANTNWSEVQFHKQAQDGNASDLLAAIVADPSGWTIEPGSVPVVWSVQAAQDFPDYVKLTLASPAQLSNLGVQTFKFAGPPPKPSLYRAGPVTQHMIIGEELEGVLKAGITVEAIEESVLKTGIPSANIAAEDLESYEEGWRVGETIVLIRKQMRDRKQQQGQAAMMPMMPMMQPPAQEPGFGS